MVLETMLGGSRVRLAETDVHQILSNPRRRAALAYLWQSPGTVSLRELSEAIATVESGESPAPRALRETIYISLHQTHLPRLHELGVIAYDRDRKAVTALDTAREVAQYMDLTVRWGFTWVEYYRTLGIVALCLVVATLVDLPGFAMLDPLVPATAALALFAGSSAYQLWRSRHAIRRLFAR